MGNTAMVTRRSLRVSILLVDRMAGTEQPNPSRRGAKLLPFNPTAENIAKWICDQIPECYKVSVQESEGNTATYTTDDDEQDI